MRIWEYVGSTAEAVKRHAPDTTPLKKACINSCTVNDTMTIWYVDSTGVVNHAPEATPLKKACINSCIAALTKIAVPVKSACRNSYDCGSAAFAKVDRTVRTVRLRRRPAGGETGGAYEKIPAEEVEEQEGLIPEPVKTNACSDGGAGKSVSYSYGFLTFAKIGYTVRVKVVYRIVQRISGDGNGTKSSVSIYATDFSHESHDGCKFIPGDHDTVKNEPKNLFDTTTFAKMVDGIKNSMSDPVTNSRIIKYTSLLGENVRCYGHRHGLALNRAAVSTILTQTLADVAIDVVKEMADSREQLSSGSQESNPEVETDDKRYTSVFEFLKEKVGIMALNKIYFFAVREFSAFLRTEPFRTQCYSERMFTVEYLELMMGKFLEFVMKRHCGGDSMEQQQKGRRRRIRRRRRRRRRQQFEC